VTCTGKISDRRLSGRAVAEVVKKYAQRAGLKAADFSGHSLRSGFLTSAAARGASIFKMMDVSRHKSIDTLRGYVRMLRYFVITRGMDYRRDSLLLLNDFVACYQARKDTERIAWNIPAVCYLIWRSSSFVIGRKT
jgi:integrase